MSGSVGTEHGITDQGGGRVCVCYTIAGVVSTVNTWIRVSVPPLGRQLSSLSWPANRRIRRALVVRPSDLRMDLLEQSFNFCLKQEDGH